ncbi:MAG: hypothetical protein Q9225_004166 [Loekoesia sp. 1 TL-2023]
MASSTQKRPVEVCANCLLPATNHCKQCGSSWYCSAECQKADWTYHKYLCAQFKDFKDRPDSDSVRAILFPEDDKTPKLVWVKMNDTELDLASVGEKLEVAELLGATIDEEIAQQKATQGIRRGAKPGSSTARTYLLVREDGLVDGSQPNMSIGTITYGHFLFSWRGPVIAVLTTCEASVDSEADPIVGDMTMTDYRDLIDFFATYGRYLQGHEDFGPSSFWWLAPALKQEMITQPQIQVVKVSCNVEQKLTGVKYEPFNIGKGHPAIVFLQPLPITASLGLPLVMRRYPMDNAIRAEAEATGNANAGPGLLLLCIDPKSKNWGKAQEELAQGNVAVMRHDQEDLHPHHLETMFMYLAQIVCPAMEETMQEEPKRDKAEVMEMLHPSRLDWFFHVFRKERSKIDERWKNTPNLFNLDNARIAKELEGLKLE